MQNDFVNGSLGTPEAQAIVPNVVQKIKNFNGQVIVTYDTHGENYMQTQEGKNLPVPHCIKGTDGHKLNPDVESALPENAIRLEKPTFMSTELPEVIKRLGDIESIELVGLCTDICVVSNALACKGYFLETPVSVDEKCCAGVTPASHDAAITTMKMCQVSIV
jgi:nicotinamidase-related amidase